MEENEIIGDVSKGIRTRLSLKNECKFVVCLSQIEPKNIKKAPKDENWIIVMQVKINQFQINEIWQLVPRPKD